jgi:branched-chain amino acid transport system ATP-binding protein
MGLSPVLVREIFKIIQDINRVGKTILLVEQNANMSLHIASPGKPTSEGKNN